MLDSYFKLTEHGTNVRTEILAGVTTFLTMAYITFVNPAILSDAGMDFGAVFVAIAMPLTFSIANGIGLGFITYAAIKILSGRLSDCPPAVLVIALLFLVKFSLL